MEDNEKLIIYNIVLSMQAQIQSLFFLLEKNDLSEEEIQENCNHPANNRKNYTVMGGKEHWVCKLCGYEYKEEELEE